MENHSIYSRRVILSENLANIKAPAPNSGTARCEACEVTWPVAMIKQGKIAGSLDQIQHFCKYCIEEQNIVTLDDINK